MRIPSLRWAALLLVASACQPAALSPPKAAQGALAITHVTLIDPASGLRPDVTILIERGRIVGVGPSGSASIPPGATVHDAAGSFAMPGLLDAHVHVSQIGEGSIGLFVANGVVGVRDMGSKSEDVARWKEVRSSGGLAPRIFWPGPKLDGTGELAGDNWVVASPDEARHAVDRLRAMDVDFVKVHYGLSHSVYQAIAEQSRKQGLWFAGHATGEFPLTAVAAGQRTIEHGREMFPCSPSEREQAARDPRLSDLCAPAAVVDQILPAMARAGTWFTPTLVSWRGQRLSREEASQLDGVRDVPPALERRWHQQEATQAPGALEQQLIAQLGPLTANAARAGVPLLTGSDAGDPYVVPGSALHDELRLFVEAGVSPLQAIRSATLEPARALGMGDEMGSIEPGKAADVVLLAADPLADIRNTRRIVAVVLEGRWLGTDQLAALVKPSG
jgi:hypothetical protein